jgi:hypothetical protein
MPVVELDPHVVVKRVNRILQAEGRTIHKARGVAAEQVGFFVVRDSRIVKQNIDLEHLAREHGALREYEVVGGQLSAKPQRSIHPRLKNPFLSLMGTA